MLLDGANIHDSNNNNVAYFNDPKFNKQMGAASLMSGAARYTAYGNLDVNMMLTNPPWAARNNFNDRILVSKVGCYTYNAIYASISRRLASSKRRGSVAERRQRGPDRGPVVVPARNLVRFQPGC